MSNRRSVASADPVNGHGNWSHAVRLPGKVRPFENSFTRWIRKVARRMEARGENRPTIELLSSFVGEDELDQFRDTQVDSFALIRMIDAERKKIRQYIYSTLPEGMTPGMKYTTPAVLIHAEMTEYSSERIGQLIRRGTIDGYLIGRQPILTERGVAQLQEWEQRSLRGELCFGGNRPGRQPRQTRPARRSPQAS